MPLHRQGRGDDLPTHNHRLLPLSEAGDSPNLEAHAVRHIACRKTHSQGRPSDRRGTLPSDNPHRMACYEQRAVNPLSEVQSVPTLWGTQAHRQYLRDKDHVLANTSSYNSSALAG